MAIKRYRGTITKGKRKGKQGFVTKKDYLKQNKEAILSGEIRLNKDEAATFLKIEKTANQLRYKGRFLNKEQTKLIKKALDELGKPYTQENINEWYELEIFFTFRSIEVNNLLTDHKGPIQINGEEFNLEEAIVEFDLLNAENYREWADRLDIDQGAIFFIVYDATYKPSTKVLNIDTMVNDETRVVTSDPVTKKRRKEERELKRKLENERKETKI